MAISIVTGTLKVETVKVKEYLTLSPTYNFVNPSELTPYIKHTGTPLVSWQISGNTPTPSPVYKIKIAWLGFPSSPIEETEIETDFTVFNKSYAVGVFESLKHIQAKDAGSIYRIIVTAKQGIIESSLGGIFAVNFRPTRPINLTVS